MARSFAIRVGVVAVSAALLGGPTTAWADDSPPYRDPSVSGTITLCDQDLHTITSGRLTDRPTVWRAVGSQRAPAPYDGPERKASLFFAQPRKGVDPAQWNAIPVTAASTYTNPDHPMAQSTVIDLPFKPWIKGYPPLWDGWLQLRLVYSVPNNPTLPSPYAAANMKVTGDTWHVVDAGSSPCDAGDAVSAEVALPYYSKSAKAVIRQQQARSSASSSPGTSATADQTPPAGGQADAGGPSNPAAGSSSAAAGVGSSSLLPWLGAAVLVLVLAAGVILMGRSRGSTGRHS